MFEVPLPSAKSPHLRRAGSRPIFTDQDFIEPGVANDTGLVFLTEVNEMKSPSMAASGVAMMPSPVFLWRFKIGWDSVMRMNADKRDLFLYEAFLYFNPLLLVTLMVWLWGVNLWIFSQSSVNYAKVFDLDHTHLTHREIWKAITFSDFFLADIMTSMSKVFSDLERSVCRMVNKQVATIAWFEADSVCGGHSVVIPVVYYWVIGSNLILRCTWTYKLSAHLRHNYLTVFTITALEIMRRFQWIFFRVENEWNKMTSSKPSLELSGNEIPKEEDRLLGSAMHNV
ncbi:EXS family [Musa troglodytarum]|uniref:EXS family n=1 Tax=Musa troglodytarum TaxID=320322 RepID=A0A9E7KFR2_9LILI|nr:EXS family [Musa troglodytarum]